MCIAPGDFDLGRGGNEFRVESFGEIADRLHDALHIHHHRFDGAGDDGEFLIQIVPRAGNALPHHHFVRGTANASQIDAFAPFDLAYSIISGSIDRGRSSPKGLVRDRARGCSLRRL
jgi:hypothetical protein